MERQPTNQPTIECNGRETINSPHRITFVTFLYVFFTVIAYVKVFLFLRAELFVSPILRFGGERMNCLTTNTKSEAAVGTQEEQKKTNQRRVEELPCEQLII